MRLDLYLFENNFFDSRRKAQDAIKDGYVLIDNKVITKCSYDYLEGEIKIISRSIEFVSRGGYKLLQAIQHFDLDFNNKLILDIGASTGGFSDCSLKFNARHVYATDVGTLQLSDILRKDPRITSVENLNFRNAKKEDFDNNIFDIVVIDVSFISLEHIFANLDVFINENSLVVALIKPQFELGDISITNKGVITKKEDHTNAIKAVIERALKNNLYLHKLTFSPIMGEKKKNIEFIGLFSKQKAGKTSDSAIYNIVNNAHKILKGGK